MLSTPQYTSTTGLQIGVIITIYVLLARKKTLPLEVKNDDTVLHIKKTIKDKVRIPVELQSLMFQGIPLEDAKMMYEYAIHGENKLQLVLRSDLLAKSAVSLPLPVQPYEFRPRHPEGRFVTADEKISRFLIHHERRRGRPGGRLLTADEEAALKRSEKPAETHLAPEAKIEDMHGKDDGSNNCNIKSATASNDDSKGGLEGG
jgi:Ubiquitin family